MYKTLCGKEYISGAWYHKHMNECEECQEIEGKILFKRFLIIMSAVTLLVTIAVVIR